MIATLLHKKTGKQIVVAVTHLKASSSIALDDVRRSQALELLQVVEEEVSKVKYHSHSVDDHTTTTTTTTNSVMPSQHNGVSAASAKTNDDNNNNNNIPVFLLGDFNADPDDPCTTEDGIPLSSSPSKDSSLPCCLADLPSDSFLSLKSSYDVEDKEGDNSLYTTWKRRGDYVAKRVIDYILYGEGVKCTHTLSVPSEDEIGENLLPSLRHPSDHISIAAKFLI